MKRETDKCMCGSSLASETASCSSLLANQNGIHSVAEKWMKRAIIWYLLCFFLPLNSYSSPYWTIFWTPLLSIRFQIFINCPQKWNCCLYLLHIFFSDDKVVNQTNIQFATLQMLLLFEKKRIDIMMASHVFFHTRHLWQKNWWNLWGKMHFSCLEIH